MNAQADYMLSESDFQMVRDVVYKHCGISLSEEKIMLVRARIAKQMRSGAFRSTKQYLNHVLQDRSGGAFTGFIDAISTNLTSFFREEQHFDFLLRTFLPPLLERKRETGDGRLLGWSAACSSGEEPYSLAITVLDAVERMKPRMACDVRLLATDISTAMLATAREGVYPSARVASVPSHYRARYFLPMINELGQEVYEAAPELRQAVRFRHLNLMDQWPFKGPFDFILCRNVMIYFDKGTQQRLVERFWNCLSPGGLLFTGHSESLTGIVTRFAPVRPSIYQKNET
ncbi:MAG TPA: protein-glutamate O-methyltransferase CheR [Phycisphaerae bacterium]|nr:protein-glutamate O-methyltransferase CheR [Phycisphaerae bacterium]